MLGKRARFITRGPSASPDRHDYEGRSGGIGHPDKEGRMKFSAGKRATFARYTLVAGKKWG